MSPSADMAMNVYAGFLTFKTKIKCAISATFSDCERPQNAIVRIRLKSSIDEYFSFADFHDIHP